MGRPRKVIDIATGKIGKEKIAARKEQEEKIKLDCDKLSAPLWLNDEAKKEFERVVDEAKKIGMLDNLDLTFLAIYANAYTSYINLTDAIRKNGYITEDGKVSPEVNAQDKYVKQIMQCSTKLGLATTDRLKLIVPTKEESETNKYLKYL